MAIGDALASVCAIEKGFKTKDFARYHPYGSLHKLNFQRVENIMDVKNIPICDENTSIKDLIIAISKGKIGAIFICKGKELKWIFTDGDVRRVIENEIDLSSKISNLSPKKPITISPNAKVGDASYLMKKNKISILPVIDKEGLLIGSVKLSQCL